MVGDHDVGLAGPRPGRLGEALRRRTGSGPRRRTRGPASTPAARPCRRRPGRARRGRRSSVSFAQSRSRWICLPSLPASPSHLPSARRASSKSVSSGSSSSAVLQLGQAQVVVAALEHREGRPPAEQRLDRVGEPGQVVVDQLGLQRQRRGRDDHRAVDEQRRRQVGQRLAGARAGLDQQVLAGPRRPRSMAAAIACWPGRDDPPGTAPTAAASKARRRTAAAGEVGGRRSPRTVPDRPVPRHAPHPRDDRALTHASVRVRVMPSEMVRVVYTQVRRIRPPGLSGSSAQLEDDLGIWLGVPRGTESVYHGRPSVEQIPFVLLVPHRRLVDRHVQPAAADQRGLLRHHHAGPLGGRHRAHRRPRPRRGPPPRRPAWSSCATRTSSPSTGLRFGYPEDLVHAEAAAQRLCEALGDGTEPFATAYRSGWRWSS